MPSYRVTWEIDIEANSAWEAATKAQSLQRTSPEGSWLGVYTMKTPGKSAETIDLDEVDLI